MRFRCSSRLLGLCQFLLFLPLLISADSLQLIDLALAAMTVVTKAISMLRFDADAAAVCRVVAVAGYVGLLEVRAVL